MGKHVLPRERVKYTTPVLQSHIDESEPCNKDGDRLAKQAKRRVEMIEPDQGVLALTDRTESTKCEPKLSREEEALAHAQVTAAVPSRNSRLRGNRMGDLAARIRRRQAV